MLCILLINSLCVSSVGASFYGSKQAFGMQFEAIYQFGDSLSDTGNYIRERTGSHSTYKGLPYGQAYHPSGRASDGLLMIDFIAMYFHLPLLNPYLATGSDFTHGADFAVVGATANGGYNSLARQLAWFRSHLNSTFSNDPIAKTIKEVSKLVPGVVKTIKDAVEEVIRLGANNIVVPGNFPIGCVPLYLVKFATNDRSKYDNLQCLKDYNTFSSCNYNTRCGHCLCRLLFGFDFGHYVRFHLGIEKDGTKKACCGSGSNPYNYGTLGCGKRGSPVCADPSKRLNWDGVHMTQHGNRCVAAFLLKQFLPALQYYTRRHRRHH
ncbi:Acetylajmalan esterase [Bienertia sinuspersici]